MSSKVESFLRKWMLLISMALGVGVYLLLALTPGLEQAERSYISAARDLQPFLVGVMLFLQFNVTGLKKCHFNHLQHYSTINTTKCQYKPSYLLSTS